MEVIRKLITLAEAQVGYHEKVSNARLDDKSANTGAANYTKYGRVYIVEGNSGDQISE